MPPITKPERAPSRPPLTSRIRSSFEGKRKKSSDGVTSPMQSNGYITQDPDALRDAVDKAINSEAFQNAIAANLAKLIKPSIRDALDTLQPVVETVYSHEMLLRRMNQSVENILERMESAADEDRSVLPIGADEWKTSASLLPLAPHESPPEVPAEKVIEEEPAAPAIAEQTKQGCGVSIAQIEAKLSELSSSADAQNSRIAEVVDGIAGLQTSLGPAKDGIDSLKAFSDQSNTNISVVQAQLDQLNTDIGTIMDAVGPELGINVRAMHEKLVAQDTSILSSHTTKLDAIAMVLAVLKERHLTPASEAGPASGCSDSTTKLEAVVAELAILIENTKTGLTSNNEDLAGLGIKVDDVLTMLEAYRTADPSSKILAAIQKSNESHASHTVALEELKSDAETRSAIVPAAAIDRPLEPHMNAIVNILESHTNILNEIKDDISAEILTTLHDIKDSNLINHNTLSEVKEGDVSDEILTALHTSNDSHTNHAAILVEIHAAVNASNDSHAAHTTALDEIKSTRYLEPVAAAEPSSGGADLGPIIATLEEQNKALAVIKESTSASNESHAAHAAALSEIKDASLASNESHTSHTTTLAELVTLAAASKDSHTAHTASLDEIKKSTNASRELHTSLEASLDEIRSAVNSSKDSHEAHTAALDEIKGFHASDPASLAEFKSIQPVASPSGASPSVDLSSLEVHFNTINSTLKSQTTILSEVKDSTASSEVLDTVKLSHEGILTNISFLKSIVEEAKSGIDANNASLKDLQDSTKSSHTDLSSNLSSLRSMVGESKSGIDEHGAAIKSLDESTKAPRSEIILAIVGLAISGNTGAGAGMLAGRDESSEEILEEVKAVRAIVEKSSGTIVRVHDMVTKMDAPVDINHTTITTSMTTLSDELKAEIDASGTDITGSISALSAEVKQIEGKGLSAAVVAHSSQVSDLGGKIDTLSGHVQATGRQLEAVKESVHLNERGVEQLQEHVVAVPISGASRNVEEPSSIAEASATEPASSPVEPSASGEETEPVSALPTSRMSEFNERGSVSTSAVASPLSPSFGESPSGEKKKGKKAKKNKKTPFVFDPEEEEGRKAEE